MDELRLTVVSDATQEFPHNQNNRFKVRLPRPLVLPEGPWAMSLWSLSVPDEAMEQRLGQSTDLACMWAGMTATLWNVQHGKYTSSSTRTWSVHTVTLADVFQTKPRTGVEWWTRLQQIVQEKNTKDLQARMGPYIATPKLRVTQPQAWTPTFRWEGEDLILEASRIKVRDIIAHGHTFAFPLSGTGLWIDGTRSHHQGVESGTQFDPLASQVSPTYRGPVGLYSLQASRTHSNVTRLDQTTVPMAIVYRRFPRPHHQENSLRDPIDVLGMAF